MPTRPTGRHHLVTRIARKYVEGDWRRFAGHYELKAYERHLKDLERQGKCAGSQKRPL